MPCRDYMDNVPSVDYTQRVDMLSRIACKALQHIEDSGDGLEILILQDPEIAKWWSAHKEADRIEQARIAHEEAKRQAKLARTELVVQARAKLTQEEITALGIK